MSPLAVVVVDVDAEDMLEVAAVEDQQPVEALTADGADEAFGDRVRLLRSHQRLDDPYAFAPQDLVEGPLYLPSRSRIKKRTLLSLSSRPRLRLLGDPFARGILSEPASQTRRLTREME
jgi:hypothetical protein